MVDGGGLENHCTRKGTGGSNPSPSAKSDPLLAGLLSLSEREGQINSPRPLPSARLAGDRLHENRITFVVLNRSAASPKQPAEPARAE